VRATGAWKEDGFSLVEVLVTIVIVGVTFSALLGGLFTTIAVSSLHRKQATADSVARSAAEWIRDSVATPYVNCAATYSVGGVPNPNGYIIQVVRVQYWDGVFPAVGAAYTPSFVPAPCSTDKGLQEISILVKSPDSQVSQSIDVVKRNVA